MRFLYGFIAVGLWLTFAVEACPTLNIEMTMLTCAIVAAGAMAGGT